MGLSIKLIITNKEEKEDGSSSNNNNKLDMKIDSSGKFKRKANWDDLSAFSGHTVTSDLLKDWIDNYQRINFPEIMDRPNRRPFKCFIFDEPKKGFTLFKDYDWNPIKLELKVGIAEIKKKVTKRITLVDDGPFQWEDMEHIIAATAEKELTSTLKKSKLAGHGLAMAMMKSSSEISSEFNGFESQGFFISEKKGDPTEIDDETGAEIWKSTTTVGTLLEGKPRPTKKEVGVKHEITAMEHFIKTRVYYKAVFTGEVSTDHKEQYEGRRYWNFPLKYLLEYNDVPKQALIYEDIEFCFYTNVCISDVEPGAMTITVQDPEGNVHNLDGVKPSNTTDTIQEKVEAVTGIVVSRQVLKFDNGNPLPSTTTTVEDMGLQDGSALTLEIYKIPLSIHYAANDDDENKMFQLQVEPCDTIGTLKKMNEVETSIEVDKQLLTFGETLLKDNNSTVDGCGMKAGSELTLEEDFDPIIFVDIKCETLFAMDRQVVIDKGALTPVDGNREDFKEINREENLRDMMFLNMNQCPSLGVNLNKVVEKTRVSDLGVQEAASVRDLWGVSLKKVERNKLGEEFYFIDPKTGMAGELLRRIYIEKQFITPVAKVVNNQQDLKETLQEAETDQVAYDKYTSYIRKAFGSEIA